MKECLMNVGSCMLALALSIATLVAVAELSVRETPSYGEVQM